MKFNWWLKAILLATLWLLLAWLIQREREKKDKEIVGELMFMFPFCDGIPFWNVSLSQQAFDSVLKRYRIDGVIFDLHQQAVNQQQFPDSNFLLLHRAAQAASLPVYSFNPDTLRVNYGWKMFNPDVFYPNDFDYHLHLSKERINTYWKPFQPTSPKLLDSNLAVQGLRFLKLLDAVNQHQVYMRQLFFSRSFQKKVNEVVFRNPHRRWLIMVHQPAHGYTWINFNNTPRYRIIKSEP